MPSLESPLWLLGLLAVPLVWWIHRFRNQGVDLPVSTVVLWRNISCPESRGHRLTTADPLWRQRAIIITAIALALTAPAWDSLSNRTVDAWFDHSLSMHTVEESGTRIELGIQQLLNTLDAEGISQATIHSLQDHSRSLQFKSQTAIQNREALQAWLSAAPQTISRPLPGPTLPEHETWLVTDGADNRLQGWVNSTGVQQIIQVGSTTENAALTRLSVRPSLTQVGFTGIASISNQGQKNATRWLQIRTQEKVLGRWSLTLQPGETRLHTFTAPLNTRLIEATLLQPKGITGDALASDDSLSLSIPGTEVALTGNCGRPMQSLLQALPDIRLTATASTSSALTIVCAREQPLTQGTTIWFHTGGQTQQVSKPPFWKPSAQRLSQLSLQPVQLLASDAQTPAVGQPLLTADGTTLISFQSTPNRLMEVRLDITAPQLTEHPAFPALVTGLMEFMLEHNLPGRIHTVQHTLQETQITPRPLQINNSIRPNNHSTVTLDLTNWFIIAALILLLFDLIRSRGIST